MLTRKIAYLCILILSACAPPAIRVIDRFPNNEKKTVEWVKERGTSAIVIKRVVFYNNGQTFSEVAFSNGRMHGDFIQYHPNGKIVTKGEYLSGKKTGKWVWYDDIGNVDSVYTYKIGLFNGKSEIYNNEELIVRQNYVNGKLNGKFVEYYPNRKKKVTGSYLDDIPHDEWIWRLEDGSKARLMTYNRGIKSGRLNVWNNSELTLSGSFKEDLQDGEWKWYRSKNHLDSLVTYNNGVLDGSYKKWHDNGSKSVIGEYLSGNPNGQWEWWSEDDQLDSIKTFSNGLLNGPLMIYYDNGELKRSANYSFDKLNGELLTYYESGQLKNTTSYQSGDKMGNYEIWAPNGNKEETGSYLSNQLHGQMKRWFSNGSPASLFTYKDGMLHGLMQTYSLSNVLKRESYYNKNNEIARFEYHDNGRFKRVLSIDGGLTLYERKWNFNGLEETEELFITGTRIDSDYFLSGDLKYECIYKGEKKHGMEWWFDDQKNPTKINLFVDGRKIVTHEISYETNE